MGRSIHQTPQEGEISHQGWEEGETDEGKNKTRAKIGKKINE